MAAVRGTLAHDDPGGKEYRLDEERRHAAGAPARLAPHRAPRDRRTASPWRAGCSTSRSTCTTTRTSCSSAARARSSTCPSSNRTWRRGCGTTRSRSRRSQLGLDRGTIRATVLIETLPAAFEMDEILYELRDHSAGLNAGRWDYIFSAIKRLRSRAGLRAARPRPGDDDRAVHARLHGAAGEDLPPPRHPRDGRHVRGHPQPQRRRGGRAGARGGGVGQAARGGGGLRRQLGGAPRLGGGGARASSTRCSATGRTRSTSGGTTCDDRRRTARHPLDARARSPRRDCGQRERGHRVHRLVAGAATGPPPSTG